MIMNDSSNLDKHKGNISMVWGKPKSNKLVTFINDGSQVKKKMSFLTVCRQSLLFP